MAFVDRIDPDLLRGALTVVRRLRDCGHEALFAGGAVRDLLLGRAVSDIDIATSAAPSQIEEIFDKTIPVGRNFGVIVVLVDAHRYEVTTFREDGPYLDGRHPSSVRFADAEIDAKRRDFTVNALFLDPLDDRIIDYVDGRADLKRGLIRTVGNPRSRFEEDRLRLMRAIRFACRLGFQIESDTLKEVAALSSRLSEVSRERIRDELIKTLTSGQGGRGLRLMLETGILRSVLPEAADMAGVQQPPQFHPEGDVFIHTCLMFDLAGEIDDPTLALAMLLHDVGKPPTFSVRERIRFDGHAEVGAEMADEICRRLRCSNALREEVVDLVLHHLRFIHVQDMRDSTLKRFLRKKNFDRHLALHRLDCMASHQDLSSYEFCRAKLREMRSQPQPPTPLLTGKDLIRMGFRPGPIFSTILRAVEDAQLEGVLSTTRDALDWVRGQYGRPADKVAPEP